MGEDRRNQQQWSHHPENKARIHHKIMANVSVISVPIKPDKPVPHGRNNSGNATNHEMTNDQCITGNRMTNDNNQRDLNMQFYETSRCCNQSETNVIPVYQRYNSDSLTA